MFVVKIVKKIVFNPGWFKNTQDANFANKVVSFSYLSSYATSYQKHCVCICVLLGSNNENRSSSEYLALLHEHVCGDIFVLITLYDIKSFGMRNTGILITETCKFSSEATSCESLILIEITLIA